MTCPLDMQPGDPVDSDRWWETPEDDEMGEAASADRMQSGGALYAAGALREIAGEVEAGAVKSSRPPQPAARPGGLVDASDWDSREDTDAYG